MLLQEQSASKGMQRKSQAAYSNGDYLIRGDLASVEEAIWQKDNETIKLISRKRNGVETIPSFLRRKYHTNNMSVGGKADDKSAL